MGPTIPANATPEPADPTEARPQRGMAIAKLNLIRKQKAGWAVPSQSGNGVYHVNVDIETPTCTCADFETRGMPCKHVFAVQLLLACEARGDGFVSGDQAIALL